MLLSESPFHFLVFQALFSLGSALLFPSYWFVDRLLSCVVVTSVERSRGPVLRGLCLVLGVPFFLLLFLLSLPVGVLGFIFWAPLHCARRPFCYQRHVRPDDVPGKTVPENNTFVFVSANLCLLPDGLARFSNLSHTQRRTSAISKFLGLAAGPEDSQPMCGPEDVLPMVEEKREGRHVSFQVTAAFPRNTDFLCLQEVFDGRASRKLRRSLAPAFPYILYDVGPSGPHNGGFKFFNSGLFLASRHPPVRVKYYYYPNARGEDALASKGLLCVKVHIGETEEKRRIVGYINCTHLHAPESDAAIRCDQMSLLLQWISDFQAANMEDEELVAFDVLCGDLNFDNCSSDDCLEQKHGLFAVYKDPCRDCAGRDCPGAVGTLLRLDSLYHEAVSTPASLKRTLESDTERRLYVAPPIPHDEDAHGDSWTGRRIDYILYRDSLQSVAVEKFQFITQLAGLSDHIPVSMHLSTSISATTSL